MVSSAPTYFTQGYRPGSSPVKRDSDRTYNRAPVHITGLLPEAKTPWKAFGTSAIVQFVALQLLIWVPLLLPHTLVPRAHYSVTPLVAMKPVSVWKPQPRPKFKISPPPPVRQETVAKIVTPRLVPPKPQPPKVVKTESPAITAHFEPAKFVAAPAPPRPRPEIKTGVLGSGGSSAPATLNRPAKEVQTGGFGDPNGVPAVGDGKRAATIAPRGSFDLPGGPGYGNGTGGAKGVRGTVQSAGFGNGVAVQGGAGNTHAHGGVQQGVFSDATRAPIETEHKAAAVEKASVVPLEILSKPDPAYTAEARRLKIEGEVLLQAVFTAAGQVRVLRVLRGLGHGLDEAAEAAARQIRFKPQRVNGNAVDSTATLHIVFQLAY